MNPIEVRRLLASTLLLLSASLFALLSNHYNEAKLQTKLLEGERQQVRRLRMSTAPKHQVQNLLLGDRMNINEASAEDLAIVPGIGKIMSEKITTWRSEKGKSALKSLAELEEIRGIGPAKLRKIEEYLRVY